MRSTVCTLFEGHYHHGVATLVNSLVAAGFEGTVWAGHRGPLPAWLVRHAGFDCRAGRLQVTPEVALQTLALDPPRSLNYQKPAFMRELLHLHDPAAEAVVYLDPDLVVKCAWAEIEAWFAGGEVALVEDLDGALPSDHPRREGWPRFFAAAQGELPQRALARATTTAASSAYRARTTRCSPPGSACASRSPRNTAARCGSASWGRPTTPFIRPTRTRSTSP
ncbi:MULTISPECIES: hypothetical protein [unclassified Variovorax]|uniref:hypothetical protein n=1 Tax=unclassified Variovorax TaxID=663243 RepID=UPI002576F609|nr:MULTISPECIES: hypothetical protein [unclassified Variovorax]MDM0090944.1 hypothetical protein [Variovorax sp. J22G40]MDM0149054.1 hypothetical protein [Variovorax sp. J2P1-31]